jgi:uncharacterized repeat protein (TIGR01451 family)
MHMISGKKTLALAALIACGVSSQAFAQTKPCVELKSMAQVEQEVVDAKGAKTKQLVEATKVVPGVEVLWTVTAVNVCKQPSDAVTINNAVPQHMSYVANTATGPRTSPSPSTARPSRRPASSRSRKTARRARRAPTNTSTSAGSSRTRCSRERRPSPASAPC